MDKRRKKDQLGAQSKQEETVAVEKLPSWKIPGADPDSRGPLSAYD